MSGEKGNKQKSGERKGRFATKGPQVKDKTEKKAAMLPKTKKKKGGGGKRSKQLGGGAMIRGGTPGPESKRVRKERGGGKMKG